MKKNLITFALLGAITLSMFSCGDKKKDEPKAETQSEQQKQPKKTSYLLSKISSKDTLITYTYNSKNHLKAVNIYNSNKELSVKKTYTYDKDENVTVFETINYEKNQVTKTTYSYTNGLVTEAESKKNGKATTTVYKYDSNKRLIEEENNSFLSVNTYDSEGNMTKKEIYSSIIGLGKKEKFLTMEFTYEGFNNPFYSKKMIEGEFAPSISPNNLTHMKNEISFFGESSSITLDFSYEYNKDDYPIKAKLKATVEKGGTTKTKESELTYEYTQKK